MGGVRVSIGGCPPTAVLNLLRYLLKYLLKGRRELEGALDKGLYKLLDRGIGIPLVLSIIS